VRKIIVGHETRELKNIQVLTTNDGPPHEPIMFHHELA
jgi:Taurine catabolism dioxygenase TauD, TfdA family